MREDDIKDWMTKESREIMNILQISETKPISSLAEYLENFDVDNENIMKISTENGYSCAICGKYFKNRGHFNTILKVNMTGHFSHFSLLKATIMQ